VFGLLKDWSLIMQVHEFRKELQDAILQLQRIAQKIDDDHSKEITFNEEEARRNAAVAQARREIEAGVTHPDVVPVSENLKVSSQVFEAEKKVSAPEPTAKADAAHAEPEPDVKHVVVKK
jgi:hypothetical protein